MWRRIIRDMLSPLLGLGIEVHEVLFAAEPRQLAVILGLLLIGVPIDSAARLLGRSTDSSLPTPPSSPSLSEGSHGG